MKLCHQPQRLGISLKMVKILPHLRHEHLIQRLSVVGKPWKIPLEPLPDGNLSEMPERRIANVMDQPCTLQDMTDILFHPRSETGIFLIFQYVFSDILSQRFGK